MRFVNVARVAMSRDAATMQDGKGTSKNDRRLQSGMRISKTPNSRKVFGSWLVLRNSKID